MRLRRGPELISNSSTEMRLLAAKTLGVRPQDLHWYGSGESVTVRGYVLKDPMVYISEHKPPENEASCIDLSLEVGTPVTQAAGSLGYYPTYARLSPGQRAIYLRWLSSGRVGPLNESVMPSFSFMGSERRLLVEQLDLSRIVKEVVRLLEVYTLSVRRSTVTSVVS